MENMDVRVELRADQLNRMFPFYLLLSADLTLESFGNSFQKLLNLQAGDYLEDHFKVHYPDVNVIKEGKRHGATSQMIVRRSPEEHPMVLQGEWEFLSDGRKLFLGLPAARHSEKRGQGTEEELENRKHAMVYNGLFSSGEQEVLVDDGQIFDGEIIRGVAVTDANGAIEWVSRDFEYSMGCSLEEVKGKRPRDVIYGKGSTHIPSSYVDEMVRKKKSFSFDNIGYNKNGDSFWFRTTVQPILDDKLEIKGRYYVFEDVTELKTNKEALKESQKLWRFAVEGAGDGVWSFSMQTRKVHVSKYLLEMLSYQETKEISTSDLVNLLREEEIEHFRNVVLKDLSVASPHFSRELQVKCGDGSWRYFKLRAKVMRWSNEGVALELFGTLTDIDNEKRKELESKRIAGRLAALLESLHDGILLENEHREIVLTNKRFGEMFGIPLLPEQMTGMNCAGMAKDYKHFFTEPDFFEHRLDEIIGSRKLVLEDELYLVDGRVFSRDYIPILIDGEYAGHLWKYNDISYRKQLEEGLRSSELRLSALVNNFNLALLYEDSGRKILFANKAFYHLLGDDDAQFDLVGQNSREAIHRVKHLFRHPDREVNKIEQIHRHKVAVTDGRIEMADGRILRQQYIPISQNVDVENASFWLYEDVTEKVMAESKLRAQQSYFHRILNELPADITIFDTQQRFEFINRSAVSDGALRTWLIGKTIYDYCKRTETDISLADGRTHLFDQTMSSKVPQQTIEDWIDDAGNERYKMRILYPFLDNANEVEFVVGFGIDVTTQIINERRVNEQRAYYHEILNEVPADIVVFSLDHKYLFINNYAVRDAEIRNWLIGKDDFEYCERKAIGDPLAIRRRKFFDLTVNTKEPQNWIESYKRPDGTDGYMLRIMYPRLSSHGDVKFVIGFGNDISEQVINKRLAEYREMQIRKLLDLVRDGIFTCSGNGEVKYYNNSYKQIIRMSAEDDAQLNLSDILPEKEYSKVALCLAGIDNGDSTSATLIRTNAGRYLDFSVVRSDDEQGDPYVCRISDITEIVTKEENLRVIIDKEKDLNNSKSQFIRITSHELRTPLTIINANAELLEHVAATFPKVTGKMQPQVFIGRIRKEVKLMTELLNELLMIGRMESGNIEYMPVWVDVSAFLQGILVDFYNPYTDGRVLDLVVGAGVDKMFVDPKLIRHVIINLVNNAFKYSTGKPSPILSFHQDEEYWKISVHDYGIGIPETDKKKLFTSFFRASNSVSIQGTGLGLMVVEYAIKQHGGRVEFESEEGVGSVFTVLIPINR